MCDKICTVNPWNEIFPCLEMLKPTEYLPLLTAFVVAARARIYRRYPLCAMQDLEELIATEGVCAIWRTFPTKTIGIRRIWSSIYEFSILRIPPHGHRSSIYRTAGFSRVPCAPICQFPYSSCKLCNAGNLYNPRLCSCRKLDKESTIHTPAWTI